MFIIIAIISDVANLSKIFKYHLDIANNFSNLNKNIIKIWEQ